MGLNLAGDQISAGGGIARTFDRLSFRFGGIHINRILFDSSYTNAIQPKITWLLRFAGFFSVFNKLFSCLSGRRIPDERPGGDNIFLDHHLKRYFWCYLPEESYPHKGGYRGNSRFSRFGSGFLAGIVFIQPFKPNCAGNSLSIHRHDLSISGQCRLRTQSAQRATSHSDKCLWNALWRNIHATIGDL